MNEDSLNNSNVDEKIDIDKMIPMKKHTWN